MPIDVGCDDYGCYDASTGADVILEYDEYGRPYNALTGQEVGNIVNATRDVLIGIFGRQGYPPTGYPRTGQRYPAQYPQGYPQYQGSSPGGVTTGGFTVNWWAAALIGVIAGAFFLGKRR